MCIYLRNPVCFDLIYYDGLGEQDKEIRLTIGSYIRLLILYLVAIDTV